MRTWANSCVALTKWVLCPCVCTSCSTFALLLLAYVCARQMVRVSTPMTIVSEEKSYAQLFAEDAEDESAEADVEEEIGQPATTVLPADTADDDSFPVPRSPQQEHGSVEGEESATGGAKRRRSLEPHDDSSPRRVRLVLDEAGAHSPQRDWFEDQILLDISQASDAKLRAASHPK
eukprot:m.238447 g.238447  ORF g.238447 m.238447 type:complete len:176 (-) comp54355_c0_seq3:57-584(-)